MGAVQCLIPAAARPLLTLHKRLRKAKRLMGFEPTTFCMATVFP